LGRQLWHDTTTARNITLGNIIGFIHLAWIIITDPIGALSALVYNVQGYAIGLVALVVLCGIVMLICEGVTRLRRVWRELSGIVP
jgi:hypothetical protein